MKRILLLMGAVLFISGTAFGQSQIFIEDFESATNPTDYTTSLTECVAETGDYFGIVEDGVSTPTPTFTNIQGGKYFAAQDIDGTTCGTPAADDVETIIITGINISGFNTLDLRVFVAEDEANDAAQDWDADAVVQFDYQIDGGGYTNGIWFAGQGATNTEPLQDTNYDGVGDGTALTDAFAQFVHSIAGTGSSMDIKVTITKLDSGDEDVAFDNIEVYGIASGGTPTQIAVTEINGGSSPSNGTAFDVTVELQDGDDNPIVASQDTSITLSLATGSGALGGTLTGTVSSGSATATLSGVTYDATETGVSITATNTGGSLTAGTSSTFEVLGAPTKLSISASPSSGFTDVAIGEFTVQVLRADDSIDLNSSASISVAKASGSGTLTGTSPVVASEGVATFSDVEFDAADDYTVTFSSTGLTSATSGTIAITSVVAPTAGTVFITEVSDADTDFNAEFIELYNSGSDGVTLGSADLLMYDASGTTLQTTFDIENFSGSTIIPANGFLIIARGATEGEFETEWGTLESNTNFNQGSSSVFLGTGRRWVLKQGSTVIDSTSNGVGSARDFQFPIGSGTFITGVQSDATPGLLDAEIEVSGSEGWRILATPTSDNSYDDLLGDIWTQGIASGADATAGTANVQTFSTSTDSFSGISDMSTNMTAGNGFIVYVYSDDDYTNSGADAGFPKTLNMNGTPNSGSVSPTLNGGTSGDDSFSLVGNPYASTIDWDLLTKTDLTGTVYVYDHSYGSVIAPDVSEAVGGGYRVWTGSTGSLTDGLITPFQGFWVQNSGGSAALTIEEADKTTGGTFYKEAKAVNFALKSEIANMYDETFFSFGANAELGKDNNDALQLSPLDYRSYMSLASRSTDDLLDVNNLPTAFDEIQVPISVKAYSKVEGGYGEMEGSAKLSWSDIDQLPESWELLLSDKETGSTINLRELSEYSFELVGTKSKARIANVLTPLQPTKEKTAGDSDRFVLTISQITSVNNEPGSEVESFALEQNYPNPFNPTTTINYSVENSGAVTLSVYNLMGQKVAELVNETKSAGSYNVTWNASQAASGMYYYRLEAGGQVLTRKMTLIK
ncbi:MAG: hypothetical protein BalsKO_07010 [Balneolaceae bacterium]